MKDDRLEVGALVFGFIMVATLMSLMSWQASQELTAIIANGCTLYMALNIGALLRRDAERLEVEARQLRIKQRQLERYLEELDKEDAAERKD
jgi:hypothetical protein